MKNKNFNIKEEDLDLGFSNPKINGENSIFIGSILLEGENLIKLNTKTPRELFIFGTTVKTGEISMKFGELKALEFAVVEKNTSENTTVIHHLAQYRNDDSILYKREADKTQYESVDMLKKKDIQYLNVPPKWKISNMNMPKYNNELFLFAKQFYIPENETTKRYIGWDETLYFFVHVTDEDELLVQMYPQDTSAQTAEDHYNLEILIGDYLQHHKNLKIVRKLLVEGDRYFFEFVLNNKRATRETLALMLELAKTKAMKTMISKRLK